MQVSEDHCWLNTDPAGGREGTIEVTTDSAAKRALPVDAAAWQGWLYSGGHAPVCSHKVGYSQQQQQSRDNGRCVMHPT